MTTPRSDEQHPPWYVTTAIPYVNAKPHIGFALEIILTDALARYHRLKGDDVRFLTGADENSLKNVQAAEKEGISTQALVDRNAAQFQALREPLNLSFDDFIRTSNDPRHLAGVRKLWEACAANGDIYKRPYQGLYCVGCEQFYTPDELVDGLCPEHLTPPDVVEEENYFFRLSRYGDRLYELIDSDQLRIVPQTRKNEALSFIRQGLEDFSISRSRARAKGWGIPVPGDPEQVIYVWFDALDNYITALGYADEGPLYQRYWAENQQRVHVIGKGILRFHTIYWPAMLLSAGVLPPSQVFVHGYVTIEGAKISKSLGNVIDPVEFAERYGTEGLRYYLLREIRATDDGDFSQERFIRTHNGDLADQLGNLLNRVVNMVTRYYDGVVPAPHASEEIDRQLVAIAERAARTGGRGPGAVCPARRAGGHLGTGGRGQQIRGRCRTLDAGKAAQERTRQRGCRRPAGNHAVSSGGSAAADRALLSAVHSSHCACHRQPAWHHAGHHQPLGRGLQMGRLSSGHRRQAGRRAVPQAGTAR